MRTLSYLDIQAVFEFVCGVICFFLLYAQLEAKCFRQQENIEDLGAEQERREEVHNQQQKELMLKIDQVST